MLATPDASADADVDLCQAYPPLKV